MSKIDERAQFSLARRKISACIRKCNGSAGIQPMLASARKAAPDFAPRQKNWRAFINFDMESYAHKNKRPLELFRHACLWRRNSAIGRMPASLFKPTCATPKRICAISSHGVVRAETRLYRTAGQRSLLGLRKDQIETEWLDHSSLASKTGEATQISRVDADFARATSRS